jgi:type IV secretion system protein VirB4
VLESVRSLARRRLEPRGAPDDAALIRHLPYVTALTDDVLMLRDGEIMATLAIDGIAAATAESALVGDVAEAVQAVVAQAAPALGFTLHRVSVLADTRLAAPLEADPFSYQVDRRWQAALAALELRERRSFLTVTLRPQKILGLSARLFGAGATAQRDLLARRIERLNETVAYLMETLAIAGSARLTVGDGRWLGLLRTLVTGRFEPTPLPQTFDPIANLVAGSSVRFEGDRFLVPGASTEDMRFGAVLSLKAYPATTAPGVFDPFDLEFDSVVTHSFTPIEQIDALARIRRTVRQMGAADDAAASLRGQLIDAADDLASGRISFGLHHASIAVFARSEAQLDEAAAQVRAAGQRAGCVLVREDIGARATWFAQHPGNSGYRARAAMISSRNFAHFTALHAAPRGLGADETPWGATVTILPTVSASAYRFNFHLRGKAGERSVGHTLVLGQTGSGKTLGTAFLIAQARRTGARVIVFDKDRGLEMPLRAMGGAYGAVRLGEATGFNPFAAETDERGRAWLADWLTALLSRDGPLTAIQSQALAQAVAANAETDPSLRRLSAFRRQFRSVDDDGALFDRMGAWDADGGFGWLFSGEGLDDLSLNAPVTGFDLTEIFETDAVRTAWLAYVFRRIERTVEDGRPTLIVLDEAWKLLDDPYFERRLKDWMLTMRKKNVAVVLLTQRVAHIRESQAGGAILESAATTILYPNSRNTPQELAPLALTDRELDFACLSALEARLALVRSGGVSAIVDMDLRPLGGLMKVLGGGAGGDWAPEGWRETPDFWKEIA